MQLLPIIVFAISVNIDNFTVATVYGIKKIKITVLSNLIIGIISAAGTLISMSIGLAISRFIPQSIANIVGNFMLIAIGMWFIKDYIVKRVHKKSNEQGRRNRCTEILDEPEKADADSSGTIDIRETVFLAVALTLNNFGLGIGASIAGLNLALTTLFTFISSLAFIRLGFLLGNSFLSDFFGKYASLAAGIIITAMGVYEMIA